MNNRFTQLYFRVLSTNHLHAGDALDQSDQDLPREIAYHYEDNRIHSNMSTQTFAESNMLAHDNPDLVLSVAAS